MKISLPMDKLLCNLPDPVIDLIDFDIRDVIVLVVGFLSKVLAVLTMLPSSSSEMVTVSMGIV